MPTLLTNQKFGFFFSLAGSIAAALGLPRALLLVAKVWS